MAAFAVVGDAVCRQRERIQSHQRGLSARGPKAHAVRLQLSLLRSIELTSEVHISIGGDKRTDTRLHLQRRVAVHHKAHTGIFDGGALHVNRPFQRSTGSGVLLRGGVAQRDIQIQPARLHIAECHVAGLQVHIVVQRQFLQTPTNQGGGYPLPRVHLRSLQRHGIQSHTPAHKRTKVKVHQRMVGSHERVAASIAHR